MQNQTKFSLENIIGGAGPQGALELTECIYQGDFGLSGPTGATETNDIFMELDLGGVHIVEHYKSRTGPCSDCVTKWNSNDFDEHYIGSCTICGSRGACHFDQDGHSACDTCSTRSLIRSRKNDDVCWQCSKKPVRIQSSLTGRPLCTACRQSHCGSNGTYHCCNDICVRYLLSMLTSAFQHKLRSMITLPICVCDLVANYVGADIVSPRFYSMHEMLFLRPKDAHYIQHKSIPRRYTGSCKRKYPCLVTEVLQKTIYTFENPQEKYIAYENEAHVCNSYCAALVLRTWQALL